MQIDQFTMKQRPYARFSTSVKRLLALSREASVKGNDSLCSKSSSRSTDQYDLRGFEKN